MKIGIPKETAAGETRVALIPALVSSLTRSKHEVRIESGAGIGASFTDEEYAHAGAIIVTDARSLYDSSEMILKVQPPQFHPSLKMDEAELIPEGSSYIGFLAPVANPDVVKIFVRRRVTSLAMEYIPRISRAQSMDALSSMATIAGYKSVLLAASRLNKMFPLFMTAAGTLPPAVILVLGAGVAGLQAIATARRLGAKVQAFDPRPAVRDQVKSLGATFIDMELDAQAETAAGYAREQSEEFLKKEQSVIGKRLPNVDVVISTAQVFGKRPPVLITADMVRMMKPGSIIVDLAAEQGGNCELTQAGVTVEHQGVTITGPVNLPASVPTHASQLYSKNVVNLIHQLYQNGTTRPDFTDDIAKGCVITDSGAVTNGTVKQLLSEKGVTFA
ncbi:MAG TPA: Re/Si-specific NAD(P)(+) transhydrogenase subunit alpha [Bacteroidetes bacterium]|nr:Re/Si-specific NAD(P)(+) transhydrogenase subunit alpha [Bacteroidota bacterium]